MTAAVLVAVPYVALLVVFTVAMVVAVVRGRTETSAREEVAARWQEQRQTAGGGKRW